MGDRHHGRRAVDLVGFGVERRAIDTSGRFDTKIVVEVTPASEFTAAETYHQDFYKKNPAHYWRYRIGCRRDDRLKRIWGKDAKT